MKLYCECLKLKKSIGENIVMIVTASGSFIAEEERAEFSLDNSYILKE